MCVSDGGKEAAGGVSLSPLNGSSQAPLVHQCNNSPMYQCISVPVHQSTTAPEYKCTRVPDQCTSATCGKLFPAPRADTHCVTQPVDHSTQSICHVHTLLLFLQIAIYLSCSSIHRSLKHTEAQSLHHNSSVRNNLKIHTNLLLQFTV